MSAQLTVQETVTEIQYVDNVYEISDIEEILGDAMVESITDYYVTIDRCQAVSECEDCPMTINIISLLTLAGEPTYIYVYGLTTKQAETLKFIYNFPQSKVDRIFERPVLSDIGAEQQLTLHFRISVLQ